MPVRIEFETGNDDFRERGWAEVAGILRDLADRCEDDWAFKSGRIADGNGNTIGQWQATVDAEERQ